MTEDENVTTEEKEENKDNSIYIDEIKKLKENTVSREDFEKLEAERNELLKAYIDGKDIDIDLPGENDTDSDKTIEELRKSLLREDSDMTNLDFWKKSLKLRKEIIERDGEDADPFLPHSSQYVVSQDDKNSVARVVSAVEDCIEKSEGNPETFRALLNSMIMDDKMPTRKR